MTKRGDATVDRRNGLRRRIYLASLFCGIPVLSGVWLVYRVDDPFTAVAYPPYILSLVGVLIGLLSRRMTVGTAERFVLAGTVVTYLASVASGVLRAGDMTELQEVTTVSSVLTITLMPMLAYVAFEIRRALRVSLAIMAVYVVIVSIRLVPDALAGRLGSAAVDHLSVFVFLFTSVGLLHVMAQVREQAAEARLTASAMEELANTDALTGIANRRHLHEELVAQVTRSLADDTSLSVVLIDIDHFKQVNDSHGHEAGDAVLKHVAQTLATTRRADDLVGRWGGEEFLIITPGVTADDAIAIAEDYRQALADAAVPVGSGITASMGVAELASDDTPWDLLRRADSALYTAKASGRDRVMGADQDPDVATGGPLQARTRSGIDTIDRS